MTPDWTDDPYPVPYLDMEDPQTLNLYAYVRNNPLNRTDPDGHHQVCDPDKWDPSTNTVTAGACHEVPDPPSADDLKILEFANQINKRNILSNTAKIYGASAVVGLTGGAGCYFLCPAATVTTLGVAGATAGPVLYKTGDVIEQVVDTPAGPIKFVGDVVVEGTKLTVKDVTIFSAETGEKLNVGAGNMLKAVNTVLSGLRQAGYTQVRVLADRVSGANPGRIIDRTIQLR